MYKDTRYDKNLILYFKFCKCKQVARIMQIKDKLCDHVSLNIYCQQINIRMYFDMLLSCINLVFLVLLEFKINSYVLFMHTKFLSFGFWYFSHFSCVILFPFFPSCPSCLEKCKQKLRNTHFCIFITSSPKVTKNKRQEMG